MAIVHGAIVHAIVISGDVHRAIVNDFTAFRVTYTVSTTHLLQGNAISNSWMIFAICCWIGLYAPYGSSSSSSSNSSVVSIVNGAIVQFAA